MRSKAFTLLVATLTVILGSFSVTYAFAASEEVLYNFCSASGCSDGWFPQGTLVFDSSGSLYGTTYDGGIQDPTNCNQECGTVFELVRHNGAWTEKAIHTFHGKDGANPAAGLVMDTDGNLFGTTELGGANVCNGYPGCGTVFRLSPGANGKWTLTTLHSFNGSDGFEPIASPILDRAGNIYGTTSVGGAFRRGIAFELTPGKGKWVEKVLHNFGSKNDGVFPAAGLTLDASGNLYGTTENGGTDRTCGHNVGCGIVFELLHANGKWTEKILHNFQFDGQDGFYPEARIILEQNGSLYGTTTEGGSFQYYGTVFELMPNHGKWTEKIIHNFESFQDGQYPNDLTADAAGKLYGTTRTGGPSSVGTVFAMTQSQGQWQKNILHSFQRIITDGFYPDGGVILDSAGRLYGTTTLGGTHVSDCNDACGGIVFQITP